MSFSAMSHCVGLLLVRCPTDFSRSDKELRDLSEVGGKRIQVWCVTLIRRISSSWSLAQPIRLVSIDMNCEINEWSNQPCRVCTHSFKASVESQSRSVGARCLLHCNRLAESDNAGSFQYVDTTWTMRWLRLNFGFMRQV